MIQKKIPAARISEVDVPCELLQDPDLSHHDTSPTSKDGRSEANLPSSSDESMSTPIIRLKKDKAKEKEIEIGKEKEKEKVKETVKEEYHYPQVIDQDVENFTTRLDTLISQFRNESLKEFLTVKRSILHEQITTVDSEKKRCNALLSTKQDEIEHLREELEGLNKSNFKNESQKEALATALGVLKLKKSAKDLATRAYLAWSEYHHRAQHKKRTKNLMSRVYRRAVINYTFLPWKQNWKVFHQTKQQKQFNERLEYEKSEISMHYNKEIEMLRARLAEAERKITTEEEEKIMIQENLKKAFMRGVCAMNFEAMSILNPGQGFGEGNSSGPIEVQKQEISVDLNANFSERSGDAQGAERYERTERIPLDEISAGLPSESKELRWKAAPVFGRPGTAPERGQVIENTHYSGLPSIPITNTQGEGKIIVVNNMKGGEAKVTGKVPIKPVIGKKFGK